MTILVESWLLFRRKLTETLRQPVWVVMGLTTPLLYLAFFAPLLHPLAGMPGFSSGNVLDVFVPGVLVLMAFGAGTGAGWIVIAELQSGVVERLRVTPVSRLALLLGTVARDVLMLLVPAIVVIAVAVPFGFDLHPAGAALLLLLLALVTATTSAVSSALGLRLRDIGSLAAIVTGVTLPLTLLSGILLPLTLAPRWMRLIAHVNPLYYAVNAARPLGAGAIGSGPVTLGFAVMAATTVVALWWATLTYRRAIA